MFHSSCKPSPALLCRCKAPIPRTHPHPHRPLPRPPKGSRYGVSLSFCVFYYFPLFLSVCLVSVFCFPSCFFFFPFLFRFLVFLFVSFYIFCFSFGLTFIFCPSLCVSVCYFPSLLFQLLNCLCPLSSPVSCFHFPCPHGSRYKRRDFCDRHAATRLTRCTLHGNPA